MIKSRFIPVSVGMALAGLFAVCCGLAGVLRHHKPGGKLDLHEILSRMNDAGKHLKTVSADLEYTTVTVLVNDRSTERGRYYFRNHRNPEILIDFTKPDPQTILFRKNKGEIYKPKINQIQEYDLAGHQELVQQFLLLGFGSDTGELKKAYDIRYLKEEEIEGNLTAMLELTPREESVRAQLSKIQLWINEESWLPVQQQFFEPGGDYLLAQYTEIKVNRDIPSSLFRIKAVGAKRIKMN